MAHEQSIEPLPLEADWMAGETAQEALERGAARRRQGRSGGPSAAAPAAGSPASAHLGLSTIPSSPLPRTSARDNLDDTFWRARLESELKSLRAALATLEAGVAQEGVSQAADGLATPQAAEQWLDALGSMQSRLARLEEDVSGLRAPDRAGPEIPGDTAFTDSVGRIGVLERKLDALAEEQSGLTDALAAVSQSLVAQRLKITTLYMAGIAFSLVVVAIWLFAKGPSIF